MMTKIDESYQKIQLFDETDIKVLNRCWDLNEHRRRNQDQYYNLFYTDHRYPSVSDPVYMERVQKLCDYLGGWSPDKHYLLQYNPGAYARMHHDDPTVGKTIVTLLDNDEGRLRGGATLIEIKDADRMLDVVDLDVGESVIYEHDVHHAVSVVREGYRRVHIGWMKTNKKK